MIQSKKSYVDDASRQCYVLNWFNDCFVINSFGSCMQQCLWRNTRTLQEYGPVYIAEMKINILKRFEINE